MLAVGTLQTITAASLFSAARDRHVDFLRFVTVGPVQLFRP